MDGKIVFSTVDPSDSKVILSQKTLLLEISYLKEVSVISATRLALVDAENNLFFVESPEFEVIFSSPSTSSPSLGKYILTDADSNGQYLSISVGSDKVQFSQFVF